MVPTVCFDTLPYCVVSSDACSAMKAEHRAQVLEVEEQQPLFVGHPEADVEHALLHLVEVHEARQQQRTHFRDGGADGMSLLAEQIPEHDRKLIRLIFEAEAVGASDKRLLGLSHLGNAREITLDVGRKHRHAGVREALRQNLQRYGLPGAGRAGDETMPVGERERQHLRLVAAADKDRGVVLVVVGHVRTLEIRLTGAHCLPGCAARSTARPPQPRWCHSLVTHYCSLNLPSLNSS